MGYRHGARPRLLAAAAVWSRGKQAMPPGEKGATATRHGHQPDGQAGEGGHRQGRSRDSACGQLRVQPKRAKHANACATTRVSRARRCA